MSDARTRRIDLIAFLALTLGLCGARSAIGSGNEGTSTPDAPSRASASAAPSRNEMPDDPPGVASVGATTRPHVHAFPSVQVNVDAAGGNISGDAANEPSIAVDPRHPNRMVIAWRQFDTVLSNFRQAGWAHSTDGGRSWTFPGVLTPGVFRSDPVLGVDSDGTFFYNSLRSAGGSIFCDVFRSTDGGVSWSAPVFAHGGDKNWLTVDRSGGIGDGNVYESWSIVGSCCGSNTFSRSTDGGLSYELPVPIPNTPIWGTMDVAPDGTLFVSGIDANNLGRFLVTRSATMQDPMAFPTFEFATTINVGGIVSVQQGPTSPNPAGLLGQVWIAVDPSTGPTAGWVYMLCSVDPPGPDPLDVHFVRSTDGGATWSAPVRVNDDGDDAWQWFGTMSVAPNGRIDVIWNDTRNSGAANISQLYYAFSTDGGATWSPNQAQSLAWNSHWGFPNQDKIGDYYHMVSDRVGAHLAWAATFNGEQDVYYLRIGDYDCNQNGVGDSVDIAMGTSPDGNHNGIPDECEPPFTSDVTATPPLFHLQQNRPNPFNPGTSIDFASPAGRVRLRVFDPAGRLVRTLFDSFVGGGPGRVEWDGRNERGEEVPSGVYLYRLEAADFEQTRKMLLLR